MRTATGLGRAGLLVALAAGCHANPSKTSSTAAAGNVSDGAGSGGRSSGGAGLGGVGGRSSGSDSSTECKQICNVDYPCYAGALRTPKCAKDKASFRLVGREVSCEKACGTPCCSGGACAADDERCPADHRCAYPKVTSSYALDMEAECVPESQVCGGAENKPCPEGQYCEQRGKFCDSNYCSYSYPCDYVRDGGLGVCHPLPTDSECRLQTTPVCGCDGVTYANDCARKQASAAWAKDGECSPGSSGQGSRDGGSDARDGGPASKDGAATQDGSGGTGGTGSQASTGGTGGRAVTSSLASSSGSPDPNACSCSGGGMTLDCFCSVRTCVRELSAFTSGKTPYSTLAEYAGCNLTMVTNTSSAGIELSVFDRTTGVLVGRSYLSDIVEICPFTGTSTGSRVLTGGVVLPSDCRQSSCKEGSQMLMTPCPRG